VDCARGYHRGQGADMNRHLFQGGSLDGQYLPIEGVYAFNADGEYWVPTMDDDGTVVYVLTAPPKNPGRVPVCTRPCVSPGEGVHCWPGG
jgi:hypothetical protein